MTWTGKPVRPVLQALLPLAVTSDQQCRGPNAKAMESTSFASGRTVGGGWGTLTGSGAGGGGTAGPLAPLRVHAASCLGLAF